MPFQVRVQVGTQSTAINFDDHDMVPAVHVEGGVEYVNGDVAGYPLDVDIAMNDFLHNCVLETSLAQTRFVLAMYTHDDLSSKFVVRDAISRYAYSFMFHN